VVDDKQQPLAFIQEDQNDDSDFWIILPRALSLREKFTLTTTYEGKDAVHNEGGGNYYPIARENWFPNTGGGGFGGHASYDMTFHIPKGMKIAATGSLVGESNEGGQNISIWKSDMPQSVAGFSVGRFRSEEAKLTNFLIEAYVNEDVPDNIQALLSQVGGTVPDREHISEHYAGSLGNMSTVPLMKKALAEAEMSEQLYQGYFGATPFKRVSVTQQTACGYGESWPELVWLPMCYFYDDNVRHQLGLDDVAYWKCVTAHEVAHQWWAHTVGFNSYRDQWMSEGFASMSASLYIQLVERNPKKFINFWNDQRTMLLERNNMGFRAIDAGPLVMGYRASNDRTGFDITQRLIYPKGAYILHMLRMMMWNNQTGDDNFKDLMHDFVKTYSGSSATTEDFKAMVEKHLTPDMQRIGGGKMDWFFDEYVYGTALPSYKLESSFGKNGDGEVVLSMKMTQSGVDERFRMLVPIYFELADGRFALLGRMTMVGNTSEEDKIPIKGLKNIPRRALLNYYDDVLASP